MPTVLIVVAVLEVLIATHVLAFAAAGTLAGMPPEEIRIGWGPGPSFRVGRTRLRFGMIPLGGSTRLPGQSDEQSDGQSDGQTGSQADARPEPPPGWSRPRQFADLSPWRRLLITLSGPAALLALAITLLAIAGAGDGPTVDFATLETPADAYIPNAPIATMIERPESVGVGEHIAILGRLIRRRWHTPEPLQPRAEWAGQTDENRVSLIRFLARRLQLDWVSGLAGVGYLALMYVALNLAPLPSLNGGQALMLLYEQLTGQPVSESASESALTLLTLVGVVVSLGLLVTGVVVLFL